MLVLLASVSAGCRPQGNVASTSPAASASASRNAPTIARDVPVVIYLIDTLRADRVGAYGNKAGLTPTLDDLALRGVVFEQASACGPWTLPSVASLFTSQFATEHGVVEADRRMAATARPLGKRLAERGYRCASFFANPFSMLIVGKEWGYDASLIGGKAPDLKKIERWLEQHEGPRTHLFVHTMEPHSPFHASLEWVNRYGKITREQVQAANAAMDAYRKLTRVDFDAKRPRGTTDNATEQDAAMARLQSMLPELRTLYDAHVAQADRNLAGFIDLLKKRGLWDNCVFVLLSDHGEELDDHRGWQHDQSLYEELLHVPLIVRFPRDAHAGKRVASPVRLLDVMPTLLDAMGAREELATCRGRSLLPLIESAAAAKDEPQVTAVRLNIRKYYKPYKERRGDFNVALRHGPLKAIWNVQPKILELYDLTSDPLEQVDLARTRPKEAEAMQLFAAEWLNKEVRGKGGASGGSLSGEALRKLEDLGYLNKN